jgi:hypothetical protein
MAYTNIDLPTEYFNTLLYTGNGSARTITGVGFQPDWVWVKDRTSANYHYLYDVLRGNNLNLFTNDTSAEVNVTTGQNGGGVGSQASDGFTIVAGNVNTNNVNTNTNLYASWNWKANGAGVSNTQGSITSTVSANTTSGFSIVSYTGNATNGATVGHGLSSPPQMVITKGRGSADAWQILTNIYHNYSEGDFIYLDTTDAKANSVNVSFLPTSTTWQMKSGQAGNTAITKIAYCFHSVKGFSKFGSYTGNGSADGTFVYTGFKPAFLIVKRYNDAGYDWLMYDNKRQVSFNVVDDFLKPNTADTETTGNANQSLDFLSNGVKFRGSGASSNGSGASYIYMAFAENPFVSSKGLPTTAR